MGSNESVRICKSASFKLAMALQMLNEMHRKQSWHASCFEELRRSQNEPTTSTTFRGWRGGAKPKHHLSVYTDHLKTIMVCPAAALKLLTCALWQCLPLSINDIALDGCKPEYLQQGL